MSKPRQRATTAVRITGFAVISAWANSKFRTEIRALGVPQWQRIGVAASAAAFAAYATNRRRTGKC